MSTRFCLKTSRRSDCRLQIADLRGDRGSAIPPAISNPQSAIRNDPLRLTTRQALKWSLAIGAAGALLFAIRAGVVLAPLAFVALTRGITSRRLITLAMAAIALLPLIYLVFQPKNPGGYSFVYASDLLGAHWVATFAVACVAAASVLTLLDLRRADHAVPGDELAQHRDPGDEGEARPVARLDPVDP
jgi:hypothetical protein